METIRVTDATTRSELAALLADACHAAKREIPKAGTVDYPTKYDRRHQIIDALLSDWEKAPA